MKLFTKVLAIVILFVSLQATGQTTDAVKMKTFIDALMKKMTLDEKLGQLNLPGSGDIVTGQAANSDLGKKIREGKVGGLFNIKSVAKWKKAA
jgi:beta-glucosidase